VTGVAGQITSGMTNLTAVADTYIYHKAPDANYGTLATLKLNNRTGNPVSKQAIVRSLLRFDLSAIPAGATVLSASLNVVQDNTSSGLIDVCEATASWGETVATWNNSSAIFGAAYYGSTNTGTTAGGAVLIPLNESGIDKVRSWMATPAENYGLGLTTTYPGPNEEEWISLRSRETATEAHRPRLTVAYEGVGAVLQPLMAVTRSGKYLPNGSTDALSGTVAGAGRELTYSVGNLGTSNLTLTMPLSVINESNCSVSVGTQPSSPVAPAGTTQLILTVTPAAAGAWSVTISVANNSVATPYAWTISGVAANRYSLIYDANGAESGSAPTDIGSPYMAGETVTVLANTGSLAKAGAAFRGWNTAADGSGTSYAPGATFVMPTQHVRLFARWNHFPAVSAGPAQTVYLDAGVAWSPSGVTNVVAWYDAADSSKVIRDGNNKVSQWQDKSGKNRHAARVNVADQPAYQASDSRMNGRPSIGAGSIDGSIGLDTPAMAAKNVYAVVCYSDGTTATFPASGYPTLFSGPGSYGEFRVMGNQNTDDFIGTYHFNNAGTFKNGSTVSSLNNVLPMPASLFLFKATAARTQVYSLGYNKVTAGRTWNGAYSEIIFTNGTEALETQQKIEGYLAHKWGLYANLPTDHPYRDAPPGSSKAVATLAGMATDPDGDAMVLQWTKTGGASAAVVFADDTATNTTATFTAEGTYTLRLTVSDTFGSAYDECAITVRAALSAYTVTYNGNGATTGTVPVDANSPYVSGSTVTVLGNTDGLARTGYTFAGWNTAANGMGVAYVADDTFAIGSNTTLYAQWAEVPKMPAKVTLDGLSQTYDGTARVVTAMTDPVGLTVVITYNGSPIAPTNSGSYAVTGTVADVTYAGWTNGTLVVAQAMPVVTAWPTASAIIVGQRLADATLTGGSASAQGSFAFVSPATVPAAGICTAEVAFAAADNLNYANVLGTVEVMVFNPYVLPFLETFEARTLGDLDGQYGWVAEGSVVQVTNTFGGSAKAGAITSDGGSMRHVFTDNRTLVWSDAYAKLVPCAHSPAMDPDATSGFYVRADGTVMAYHGAVPVSTGVTVAEGQWVRYTVRSDYTAKIWTLYINGSFAGKYAFFNTNGASFSEYKVLGKATFVDDIALTLDAPALKAVGSVIVVR